MDSGLSLEVSSWLVSCAGLLSMVERLFIDPVRLQWIDDPFNWLHWVESGYSPIVIPCNLFLCETQPGLSWML